MFIGVAQLRIRHRTAENRAKWTISGRMDDKVSHEVYLSGPAELYRVSVKSGHIVKFYCIEFMQIL